MSVASQPIASAPIAAQLVTGDAIVTTMFAYDTAIARSFTALLQGLAVNDTASGAITTLLLQALYLTDTAIATASFENQLTDTFAFSTSLSVSWAVVAADSAAFTTASAASATAMYALAEQLVITDAAPTILDALVSVVSAIILEALFTQYQLSPALDSVLFSQTILDTCAMVAAALTAAVFTDTTVPAALFTLYMSDSVVATDTPNTIAKFMNQLADSVGVSLILGLNGAEYNGFVINSYSHAASTYTNFPFNSFASFNGNYYGGSEFGLMLLGGTTDNGVPITPVLRTGLMNFGSSVLKRIPVVYLGYTSDQQLVLKVTVTGPDGQKEQYWYGADLRPVGGAITQNRVKIDRGLRSVYWQFELTAINGAQLSLDSMTVFPMLLDRRV